MAKSDETETVTPVENARYRTRAPCFIEPHWIPAGKIIVVPAAFEPGDHLEPLNDPAQAAFDKWEEKVREAGGDRPPPKSDSAEVVAKHRILSIEESASGEGAEVDLSTSLAEALASPGNAKPGPTG